MLIQKKLCSKNFPTTFLNFSYKRIFFESVWQQPNKCESKSTCGSADQQIHPALCKSLNTNFKTWSWLGLDLELGSDLIIFLLTWYMFCDLSVINSNLTFDLLVLTLELLILTRDPMVLTWVLLILTRDPMVLTWVLLILTWDLMVLTWTLLCDLLVLNSDLTCDLLVLPLMPQQHDWRLYSGFSLRVCNSKRNNTCTAKIQTSHKMTNHPMSV